MKDERLDFLRVISMFLVIVIHVCNCYGRNYINISMFSFSISTLLNIIARVSVPIFFMISGALLIPKEVTKEKYKNRVKRMVITLIIWTVIYLVWEYFFLNNTYNILSLIEGPARAHLWFMYAIIALYIALPFICKMANNLTKEEENLFIILWLVFSGFSSILNIHFKYNIPIISGTYYLGYFLIGHIIYKRLKDNKIKEKVKTYNPVLICISFVSTLIMFIVTIYLSNKTAHFFKGLLTYKNILMVASSISIYIYVLTNGKEKYNLFSKIAPYSFGVYLIHGIFLDILKNLIDMNNINSLIGVPIFSCILFIVSIIAIYLLKKIPKINNYIC